MISLEEVKQVFNNIRDPLKVNEAARIILDQRTNPQFIFTLLKLFNILDINNDQIIFQYCTIECYFYVVKYWSLFTFEIQQSILNQILQLNSIIDLNTYFPYCIEYIFNKTPQFRHQIIDYVFYFYQSPNFRNFINSYQFISILKIIHHIFKSMPQVDFSNIFIFIMQNATIFEKEVKKLCIEFLQTIIIIRNSIQNDEELAEYEAFTKNYEICFRLFCNFPYDEYSFYVYWDSFYDFVRSNILTEEESKRLFEKGLEILQNTNVMNNYKLVLLIIFSENLSFFSSEISEQLFQIGFIVFSQILNDDGSFSKCLEIFDSFLNYFQENGNIEFILNAYLFIKGQILNNTTDILINAASIGVFMAFLTNSPDVILNDNIFFIQYLMNCLNSNFPLLQEIVCCLLDSCKKFNLKFYNNLFSDSIPQFLKGVVLLLTSPDTSWDLRNDAFMAFVSMCEKENDSGNDIHNGLFEEISKSQNLFLNENFDIYVCCLGFAILLDPTITNEQLISSYQIAQNVILTSDVQMVNLISKAFFLLESIFSVNSKRKRNISLDYFFTLPIIQAVYSMEDIPVETAYSILDFLTIVIKTYKNDSVKFDLDCIQILFPFLPKIEYSKLKMKTIHVISLAAKYSLNADYAILIINIIFEIINKGREIIKPIAFKISRKIIQLLDSENLNTLFSISMSYIYNIDDNKPLAQQVLKTIVKIFNFAYENLNNPKIIEIIRQLINDFMNKKLKFQANENESDGYSLYIQHFCDLITTIWNFQSEQNISYFIFLLNFLLENNNNCSLEVICKIVGTFGDAFEMNVISGNDLQIMIKINNVIISLSQVASCSDNLLLQQDICYLLDKILNCNTEMVSPFVDQFLVHWFSKSLETIEKVDDIYSTIFINISYLFFQIYGKTKPNFPSSQANDLLVAAIQHFPLDDPSVLNSTKQLLDSILANFFTESDMKNIPLFKVQNNDQINFLMIYTLLALSFIKILCLNENGLIDRELNGEDIVSVRNIVLFMMKENEGIRNEIFKNTSCDVLQKFFPEIK